MFNLPANLKLHLKTLKQITKKLHETKQHDETHKPKFFKLTINSYETSL